MEITELLSLSCERSASDLHLSAGEPPRLRIDGEMESLDHPALSAEVLHTMMQGIMAVGQRNALNQGIHSPERIILKLIELVADHEHFPPRKASLTDD